MALLGFGDLKDQVIHPLWNLTEMKKVQLVDGTTFDDMVREATDMANAASGSLLRIPHYSQLFSVQDSVEIEYPVGGTGGIQSLTEFSVPDPIYGDTTGHNIPIEAWVRTLGWTQLSLEERSRALIDADLKLVVENIVDQFQVMSLTRLFKMEAEAVGSLAGASVPLADGGVADSDYVPMRGLDGKQFANTHDHYLRQATPVTDALFFDAFEHLREHGHKPPFEVLISSADYATWAGLTGWRKPQYAGIVYRDVSSGTDRAQLPGIEDYVGIIETDFGLAYVWMSDRVPTGYYNITKAYGVNDPRSPLRMRIDPNIGWGWQVLPGMFVNAPLNLMALRSKYRFGIGEDRTNGVCVYNFASGDYISPTIS